MIDSVGDTPVLSDYMQRAIELAKRGINTTTPNPRVGCVIVKSGEIIGEGYHEKAGQSHAEINALKDVINNGHSPRGATAYVTLEPCSHHGKTPPCANALIDAGIAKVIVGSRDPNPEVSGRGVNKLRNAGITVVEDILRAACDELNLGFFKRMTQGLPWVTVKLGMTLDAKIATAAGESQWITGEAARTDVQHLRVRSCAVMTSSATVIADDPSLNVRLDEATRQPKRVIVDSQLTVPQTAKIFSLAGQTMVYYSQPESAVPTHHSDTVNYVEARAKNNHTDLTAVLNDLAENHHCNEVLVEAGGRFVGALLAEDVIDELVIYTAPILFGDGARPAFHFPAVTKLADAKRFCLHDCVIMDNDLKVIYRKT